MSIWSVLVGGILGIFVLWPLLGLHNQDEVRRRNPKYDSRPWKSWRGCLFWLLMGLAVAFLILNWLTMPEYC